VVALALRHLTESIERGQPIYVVVENVDARVGTRCVGIDRDELGEDQAFGREEAGCR
jgi:hypothetical protein